MSHRSPAPGVEQTAHKAYYATAVSFLAILLSAWVADGGSVEPKEVGEWVLLGLVGSGLTGGATWRVRNRVK